MAFLPHAVGDFKLFGSTTDCDGVTEAAMFGSEGPMQVPVYIPGTEEDLIAAPIGDVRSASYMKMEFGGGVTQQTIVGVKAVKATGSGDPPERALIALGDSFSSGEGAYDYKPETSIEGTNHCHLSNSSYPYEAGLQLPGGYFDTVKSFACSGATTPNLTDTPFCGSGCEGPGLAPLEGAMPRGARLLQTQGVSWRSGW